MGDVLYHGGYKPVQISRFSTTLYENFTVVIPSGFPTGPAQLNVAHSGLIGVRAIFLLACETKRCSNQAGFIPYIQTLNITLNVV